jgi:hypothetical protein
MRDRVAIAVLLIAIGALAAPRLAEQQRSVSPVSADAIRNELEAIKKLHTLPILPATGTEDSGGGTLLHVENASAFPIVVLIVGPTTERVELPQGGARTLKVLPGDYEIAVKAVGRDLQSLYGKQTIEPKRRFGHKFAVPAL